VQIEAQGKKKAAELKDKSGKQMMQKMNGENKPVEIRDLVDEDGCAAGTEVVEDIGY